VLNGADELMPHQTIVFCATKHHVEYLLALLQVAGWTCAHIYSSLHQAARTLEMKRFRDGEASLLIVTDVAARGIDLPSMAHVVNYDLPASPRVFVHRVGRTARAGKSGWAWSIVTGNELPHLCDLQLFLARPLEPARTPSDGTLDLHASLRLGTLPRQAIDTESEHILTSLHASSSDAAVTLPALRQVVTRAQKLYERSSIRASQESHRRAKSMLSGENGWALAGNNREESGVHDVIRRPAAYGLTGKGPTAAGEGSTKAPANRRMDEETALAREALLAKINGFNPTETVFEVGTRGANPLTNLMRSRRTTLAGKQAKAAARVAHRELIDGTAAPEEEEDEMRLDEAGDVEMADEEEIEVSKDVRRRAGFADVSWPGRL
jgi:ATP-dependent RNA helicase DDX54/DBP10